MIELGTKKYKINFIDFDKPPEIIGTAGDNETRGMKITIVDDTNKVFNDDTGQIVVSLLCKGEGSETIYRSIGVRTENNEYYLKYPNSIFTKNQTVQMQIVCTEGTQEIKTPIFKSIVKKSLTGGVEDDRDIYIDLEKVHQLALNYEEKYAQLEAIKKDIDASKEQIDANKEIVEQVKKDAETLKQDIINLGETTQTEIENKKNTSIEEITDSVNKATQTSENHLISVANDLLDENKTELNAIKSDFEIKKQDFDANYNNVRGILDAENSRVEAEKLRQEHDERVQNIINEGLEAELGEYARRDEIQGTYLPITDFNGTTIIESIDKMYNHKPAYSIGNEADGQLKYSVLHGLATKINAYAFAEVDTNKVKKYIDTADATTIQNIKKELENYATKAENGELLENVKELILLAFTETLEAKKSLTIRDTNKQADTSIWIGTQAEYDALATKDANTLYFIKES